MSSNWVRSLIQLIRVSTINASSSGMLSSAETVDVIAETLQAHQVPAIVLDPVISSSLLFISLIMLIIR